MFVYVVNNDMCIYVEREREKTNITKTINREGESPILDPPTGEQSRSVKS